MVEAGVAKILTDSDSSIHAFHKPEMNTAWKWEILKKRILDTYAKQMDATGGDLHTIVKLQRVGFDFSNV